jgi:hypothetical protein
MGSGVMRYSPWTLVTSLTSFSCRTGLLTFTVPGQDGAAFVADLTSDCRQLLSNRLVGQRQSKEHREDLNRST